MIKKLLDKVKENDYDFILGIGLGRKDGKRIRFDRKYVNQYGRRKILPGARELYMSTWNLEEFEDCYYSDKRSNGPCNHSAFLISKLIDDNKLKSKFAFIHVPKKSNQDLLREHIKYWVKQA